MFPHKEFFEIDLDSEWHPVEGYPRGICYQELAGQIDLHGLRARLVKFEPNAYTTEPVVHETAEMVFIYSGTLVVGCDQQGYGGTSFAAPTFAIRPGQISHGPFAAPDGCIMLELHMRT